MRTAVSGYCYSSCSRMFLGGNACYFTDDYLPETNNFGFHGQRRMSGSRATTRRLAHRLLSGGNCCWNASLRLARVP
jgi:hypothetical protein